MELERSETTKKGVQLQCTPPSTDPAAPSLTSRVTDSAIECAPLQGAHSWSTTGPPPPTEATASRASSLRPPPPKKRLIIPSPGLGDVDSALENNVVLSLTNLKSVMGHADLYSAFKHCGGMKFITFKCEGPTQSVRLCFDNQSSAMLALDSYKRILSNEPSATVNLIVPLTPDNY